MTVYYTGDGVSGHSREVRSVSTPHYWSLLAAGKQLPENGLYFYQASWSRPLSTTKSGVSVREPSYTFANSIWNGRYGRSECPRIACMSASTARNIVYNKLIQKVRSTQIDLGVALGEYHQTAAFVAGTMSGVAKSLHLVKRGNFSGALRVLTSLSNNKLSHVPLAAGNTWLAYTYGLRPLLKDVFDAVHLLQKDLSKSQLPVELCRAGHSDACYGGTDSEPTNGVSYYHWSGASRLNARGKIRYVVSNPLLRTLDQCGVLNPLSVAWELVPYSFVVDWFLPVGQFLTSVMPPQGVSYLGGTVSVSVKCSTKTSTTIPNDGWSTSASITEKLTQREVLSSLPSPSFIVPDLSLSKSQVMSGVSLLTQIFARR